MPTCSIFVKEKSSVSKKTIEQVVFFIFTKMKKKGHVSVHTVSKQTIRRLNRVYRGKDSVTDVLSFSVDDEQKGEDHDWGDLFLCEDQVLKQAKEFSISFEEEFFRMLAHGMLHLFGYDHEEKKDADVMFPLQEKLLKQIVHI